MSELSELQSQLVRAINEEDHVTVDHLLNDEKVDPNVETENLMPLQRAATLCNVQMLRSLLDAGADPNGGAHKFIRGSDARSALHHCIVNQNLEAVTLLVERGANVRYSGWRSWPIRTAIFTNGRDREIIKVLVDAKADINCRNKWGWTPLQVIMLSQAPETDSDVEFCSFLVDQGADINLKPNFPLVIAAKHGKVKLVTFLLERGAILHNVALHEACSYEEKPDDMLEMLIRAGIPIDCRNDRMFTPLHSAVHHQNKSALLYLLKAGANVNSLDVDGRRPIHLAAKNKDIECVDILLRAGSKVPSEFSDLKFLDSPASMFDNFSTRHDYIEYLCCHPTSLRDICILTIRKILAPALQTKVCLLPLPIAVQKEIALDF